MPLLISVSEKWLGGALDSADLDVLVSLDLGQSHADLCLGGRHRQRCLGCVCALGMLAAWSSWESKLSPRAALGAVKKSTDFQR